MTSKNFSLGKKTKGFHLKQRELCKRRLWPIGLILLMYFTFYVVAYLIALSVARGNYASAEFLDAHARAGETVRSLMVEMANRYLGCGVSSTIASIGGLVLSLQGFSYLHHRSALDFYESQPILRRSHFIDLITNSFLIFILSHISMLLIALLLTAVYGAMSVAVLQTVGIFFLTDVALFLACFAIATLASMLTGNPVIALLATAVLFFFEACTRLLLAGYQSEYFATYPGWDDAFVLGYVLPFHHASHAFGEGKVWHNLIVAAAFFALSYLAYSRRKNESAGSAVAFRQIRTLVKIAIATFAGLFGGLILSGTAGKITILCFSLFCVLVAACVMEIIYAFDFKALFRHLPATFIAMALTLAVILGFMFDIVGYDKYIPNPARVESVIVHPAGFEESYYRPDGSRYVRAADYYEEHMIIKDAAAVTELVKACQEGMPGKAEGADVYRGSITVHYKMASGRRVSRLYRLPGSMDPGRLDVIFSDPAFKEGYYPIYHTEALENAGPTAALYDNEIGESTQKEIDLQTFKAAYLADLEKLDIAYAKTHRKIGRVQLQPVKAMSYYVFLDVDVYEGFDQTIGFLKKEGLFLPPATDTEHLPEKIEITAYPSSFAEEDLLEKEALEETLELSYDEPEKMLALSYDEPAKIKEILDMSHLHGHSIISSFYETDGIYDVTVHRGDEEYGLTFRKNEVPDFVVQDFKKLLNH